MGVCDPATKRCWKTRGAGDVSGELADILDMFLAKDSLNDFVKFNAFYDPAATLAVSAAAAAVLPMGQRAELCAAARRRCRSAHQSPLPRACSWPRAPC